MKKIRTQEKRDLAIKELMSSIRKNTQDSKCIEIYEALLNEISDPNVVDTAITDMFRFIEHFSRLSSDVDHMKGIDFISRILTKEFIQPHKFFLRSHKIVSYYLAMNDILRERFNEHVYKDIPNIDISNKNILGNLSHKDTFTKTELLDVINYFNTSIAILSGDEVSDKLELSRKVVLLFNYMAAIVKAFIQTKRRSLGLDKNSKKFK